MGRPGFGRIAMSSPPMGSSHHGGGNGGRGPTKSRPRGAVRYPPFEVLDDAAALCEVRRFRVTPFGAIQTNCAHIPYNSGKKDFFEKTGRESFEVFKYDFIVPGDDAEYTVMWDYNVGLVRMTPFFKCCQYGKTIPAKMLGLNPGLKSITHSITGGSISAQGYWMPFDCARAVCATFCHRIAGALIPLFGPAFPRDCMPTGSQGFGRMIIDPKIIAHAAGEAETSRRIYTFMAQSPTAASVGMGGEEMGAGVTSVPLLPHPAHPAPGVPGTPGAPGAPASPGSADHAGLSTSLGSAGNANVPMNGNYPQGLACHHRQHPRSASRLEEGPARRHHPHYRGHDDRLRLHTDEATGYWTDSDGELSSSRYSSGPDSASSLSSGGGGGHTYDRTTSHLQYQSSVWAAVNRQQQQQESRYPDILPVPSQPPHAPPPSPQRFPDSPPIALPGPGSYAPHVQPSFGPALGPEEGSFQPDPLLSAVPRTQQPSPRRLRPMTHATERWPVAASADDNYYYLEDHKEEAEARRREQDGDADHSEGNTSSGSSSGSSILGKRRREGRDVGAGSPSPATTSPMTSPDTAGRVTVTAAAAAAAAAAAVAATAASKAMAAVVNGKSGGAGKDKAGFMSAPLEPVRAASAEDQDAARMLLQLSMKPWGFRCGGIDSNDANGVYGVAEAVEDREKRAREQEKVDGRGEERDGSHVEERRVKRRRAPSSWSG